MKLHGLAGLAGHLVIGLSMITTPSPPRPPRRAGLPARLWHTLRHSFGTHAALFGAWRLQAWMGHKRIDETVLYVHVAGAHGRELPECVREAALGEGDPDARVLELLGTRRSYVVRT